METYDYEFVSCFGEHIETFISLKRKNGFVYNSEAYLLKKFDEFSAGRSESGPGISRELASAWGTLRDSETRQYLSKRMSVLRKLCIYLNSLGTDSYVPRAFTYKSGHVSHVMDDGEIAAFFLELDADLPAAKNNGSNQRLNFEMKILFRMIYCCGLRVLEATHIKLEDIDFEAGTVAIYHSKGRKDRLIYFSEDMKNLIRQYLVILWNKYGVRSQMLFPAQDTGKFFQNASVGQKFNRIWERTAYVQKPIVHSLRHSFVVKRMNLWMENNEDLKALMTDEELEQLAPWNKTVKVEFQRRVDSQNNE